MDNVYIHGAGMTRFGRLQQSLSELFFQACEGAIFESGIEDYDCIFVGAMNPEEFEGEANLASIITDLIGMVPTPAMRIETASATGAAIFQVAAMAVASGVYNRVLVLAGEKMTGVETIEATRILAEVISKNERNYGASMPALAALVTRRYMYDFGMNSKDLALVAVKNHFNASFNPYAHFRSRVSLEKVLTSKIIASPLRIFDCGPISDGAAAVVLSNEPSEVKLIGMGHGTDYLGVSYRESLTSFTSSVVAAKKAYKMAGIEPRDVDFAEIHDAFTSFEIIGSEDCGFFPEGHGYRALRDGKTQLDGSFPINPSGGLKARGHPVGASGLAQLVEIFWQLQGKCKERQVKGRVGLAQSIGGFATNNFVTILQRV
ncbi:hypothetical protein ACFL35_10745 [Candidatus Riflebacteria bacterium]